MLISLLSQPGRYLSGWLLMNLTTALVGAQPLTSAWQQTLGGRSYENAYALTTGNAGEIGVAGVTYSRDGQTTSHHGNADYWVVKLNEAGKPRWQQALGGTKDEHARAIKTTTDGGLLVAGYTYSNDGQVSGNHGGADYWVVRLDDKGDVIWQQALGGTKDDLATALTVTTDGGYLVAGYTESTDGQITGNHGQQDGWLVKLNSAGTIVWQRTLGGSGRETINAVTTTADGGFVVAGSTESTDGQVSGNHGGRDYWVVKLDTKGDLVWQQALGGTKDDFATALTTTTDGHYVITGYTSSDDNQVSGNQGARDYWVVKLDERGSLIWQRTLGGPQDDFATAVTATANGHLLVAGYTFSNNGQVSNNAGRSDAWLVRLDANGDLLGQQALGGHKEERAYVLLPTADNQVLVAGFAQSSDGHLSRNNGREDGWIFKTAVPGNPTPEMAQSEATWDATLLGNPVKEGRVSVEVRGASGQPLRLRVSNLQGQLVTEHHIAQAGDVERHSLDVGGQPVGILLLQVISPERAQTLKFVKAN